MSNFRNCVLIDELDSDLAFTFAKNGIFTLSIFTNCQDYCERVTKHLRYLDSNDNNSAGRIVSLHASTNQFEHMNIFECILAQSSKLSSGYEITEWRSSRLQNPDEICFTKRVESQFENDTFIVSQRFSDVYLHK
jgi:hypothetical protein